MILMSGRKGMKRRKVEGKVDGGPGRRTCGSSGTRMNMVEFKIPSNKTGLVVGKGGRNIRQIIRQINLQSQARVEIQRNLPPDQMYKTFIIKGIPDQIVLAQQLIQGKIGGNSSGGPPDMHMGPLSPEGPHGAPGGLGLPAPQGNFGKPPPGPELGGPSQGPPQQAQPPQQFQAQQSCSEAPNRYQLPQPNAAQQNEIAPQEPSAASAGPSETRSASNVQNQNFGDVQANQFNANVGTLVNLYGPALSQTSSAGKKAELEKKFLDTIKQNASKKTEEKIVGPFEDLKVPDRQVNPGFKITKYYRGQTALGSDVYQPDTRYSTWRINEGESVELDQFLDKVHYAALIGDAGSGKTTTAKRFTRHALKKEIESLKYIRLVHFVTLASIDGQKEHTLFDLIFAPFMSYATEELRNFGYGWVREHRNEILLVFDGLDQANWRLENSDSLPKINYDNRASATIIFHNLLNEGLLENCKILLTSREHAIKDFTFHNRPAVTISLTGLTMDDRIYLIRELSGNSADDVLQHLQHISPGVLSVCQSPLLLQFSVAVHLVDPTNVPDTFSGILLRVLAYFRVSENRRQVADFPEIFKKLKKLAYNGTSEERVLFSFDELEALGLEINEIRDLMAVTPRRETGPHFHLMEEGSFFIVFFCHQSIQEALTALHVAELPLEEFQSFVSVELLQPRMEVVRRFLFGILFSTSASSEDKLMTRDISNKSSKMEHVKNWLNETYIPQEKDGKRLCRLLSECGSMLGNVCNGHLPRLNCTRPSALSDEDQFALASVLRAVSVIDELSIYGTIHLSSTTLSALAENLMKIRNLQVVYLASPNEDDEPRCDAFVKIARHATYKGYSADPNNRPENIERWLEVLKNKGFQFLPMQVSVDCAMISVAISYKLDPGAISEDDVPVNKVQSHFLEWLKSALSSDTMFDFWQVEDNLRIKSTGRGQLIFDPLLESFQDSTP